MRGRRPTFDEAALRRLAQVIIDCNGSRARAAKLLGITTNALKHRINQCTLASIYVPEADCSKPEAVDAGAYLPTPLQIRRRSRRIQKGWTPSMERARRGKEADEGWTVPAPGQAFYDSIAEAVA